MTKPAPKTRILVVEDDRAIQMGLVENLQFEGFQVFAASDGAAGLKLARETKPDLILLDLMLPSKSGYEVCKELRTSGSDVPVIMLTARHDEFDKVHGFEVGADDYVTKPFSLRELLARIKAILARGPRTDGPGRAIAFGDCVLDAARRVLVRKGRDVTLTRTEYELLHYLCSNADKALSRDQILNEVWGTEYYGTQRSLDSFVAALRAKIEPDSGKPRHIKTVHGVGYKFVAG